ncbi:threonine--tRNA ligase, partial [Buchnera aphidicola (Stegophylla sp.)]|nr:threonine--tRNA ligase [Buchnera aphidicola (Stegophylla sp.)]
NINTLIIQDSKIFILTIKDEKSISFIQRSCVQLLSYACKIKWPCSKIGMGNILKNGFYCDIDVKHNISKKDIYDLEILITKLIKKKYCIIHKKILKKDVINIFEKKNEIYKVQY